MLPGTLATTSALGRKLGLTQHPGLTSPWPKPLVGSAAHCKVQASCPPSGYLTPLGCGAGAGEEGWLPGMAPSPIVQTGKG